MSKRRILHSLLVSMCAGVLALPAIAGPADEGELLVGNKSAASVWRVDMGNGARSAEVATGQGPHEIAVAPDGRRAVVADYGTGAAPGKTLTVIDLASGATRTIDLGRNTHPHGLRFLPDGKRILVTTEGSDVLAVVDLAAGRVERAIDIGPGKGHMVALSKAGDVAYVTKVGSGQLVRVDLARALSGDDAAGAMGGAGAASGAAVWRQAPAGGGAEGVEIAPDGRVWVSNREDGTVTVHDPDSLAVLHTLASPGFPIRLVFTPDGRHALVTNARAATLSVFDAVSRDLVATVPLEPQGVELHDTLLGGAALPIGAIAEPSGRRVFVAISGADRIAVIDTATWTVMDYWKTGREPDALGIVGP